MKKSLLLVTALVCASSVVPVVASADKMYEDLLKYVYVADNVAYFVQPGSYEQISLIYDQLAKCYEILQTRLIELHLHDRNEKEIEKCKKVMDKIIACSEKVSQLHDEMWKKKVIDAQ